jgi:hypothetical protein
MNLLLGGTPKQDAVSSTITAPGESFSALATPSG